MNKQLTRQELMDSPGVHYFVKDVLKMSIGQDPVDVLHDVELVLIVLRNEWDGMKKERDRLLDMSLRSIDL